MCPLLELMFFIPSCSHARLCFSWSVFWGGVVVGKVVSIVTQHVQFPNTSCIDSIFDKFIWFYQYYSSDRRPSDSIVVCFTRWEALNSWIQISCYVVAAATISGYSLAIVCILKLEGAIVFTHSEVINNTCSGYLADNWCVGEASVCMLSHDSLLRKHWLSRLQCILPLLFWIVLSCAPQGRIYGFW